MTQPPIPRASKDEPNARPLADASPPRTVEELRSLLVAIARGDSGIALGAKGRTTLGRILELQGSPSLLSITTLSDAVGTSPSTITRMAQSLGYRGFAGFQEALLSASMVKPGSFYLNQAQAALRGDGTTSKRRATQLCRENQANIDRLIDAFDTEGFDQCVTLIASAPRVAVYGVRQFHAFAAFLTYGLRMVRSDVALLDANALGIAEELASMDDRDVLIVASCAPYSRGVAEVAKTSAECGLKVISITDRASSPLVDHSTVALFAAHESSFLSNSMTAFIALAECLINGVAATSPEDAKTALSKRDKLIQLLSIE